MKDLLRNPVFYYVLIPVLAGAWPLSLWLKFLPQMTNQRDQQKTYIQDANDKIREILTLDPERLSYAKKKGEPADFEYEVVVYKVAQSCGLPTPEVFPSPKVKDRQTARVKLSDVGIVQCARFLSTLQMHWSNLQCTLIRLDNKKTAKDRWDVSLEFAYYYF